MVSRVLGLVRDVLMAAILGTGPVADAFFVAFRLPNLFRRLLAEGAFSAGFVPLFSDKLAREGRTAARTFSDQTLSVLVTCLVILTLTAQLAMPWLAYLIAPGFSDNPDTMAMVVLFAQITLPYLAFMSLMALLAGVLNALGRFMAVAAAPILLNLILIAVLVVVAPLTGAPGTALSWGVTISGALQFFLLLIAIGRAGFAPRIRYPWLTDDVKRLMRLALPAALAGAATQINILVGSAIASFQEGAVSFLFYADRLYQLPLGVIGVAIGVILLPTLTDSLARGDEETATQWQNKAIEISMLFTLPAMVALIVIPAPIITTLFEHGAFSQTDSAATISALIAFAPGLVAFVLIRIFSPAFFARQNTRTPLHAALLSMFVNVAGSLLLFPVMGHVGIAVATTLSAWVNAGYLGWHLWRQNALKPDNRLHRRLWLTGLASIGMGLVLWGIMSGLGGLFDTGMDVAVRVFALAILVLAGLGSYGLLCQITGAMSWHELRRDLSARR